MITKYQKIILDHIAKIARNNHLDHCVVSVSEFQSPHLNIIIQVHDSSTATTGMATVKISFSDNDDLIISRGDLIHNIKETYNPCNPSFMVDIKYGIELAMASCLYLATSRLKIKVEKAAKAARKSYEWDRSRWGGGGLDYDKEFREYCEECSTEKWRRKNEKWRTESKWGVGL